MVKIVRSVALSLGLSQLFALTATLFMCPKLQAAILALYCHFHAVTVTWQCVKAGPQLHSRSSWTR